MNGSGVEQAGLWVYDITMELPEEKFPDGSPFEFMTSQFKEDRGTWAGISTATLIISFV